MAANLIKRKWDVVPKEKRSFIVEKVITYLKQERDMDIGIIAAEEILDFFQEELFDYTYNQAVEDTRKFLRAKFDDLEVDLDLLSIQEKV